MKNKFLFLAALLGVTALPASGATVYGLVDTASNDNVDGSAEYLFLSSSFSEGSDFVIDEWSYSEGPTAQGAGGSVTPLLFQASTTTGDWEVVSAGPAKSGGGTFADWNPGTVSAGTYFWGFAASSEAIKWGTTAPSGSDVGIPIEHAWRQLGAGGNAAPPTGTGEAGDLSSFGGTYSDYFGVGVLGTRNYNISFSTTPIPEPSSALLLLLGFGLAARRRR